MYTNNEIKKKIKSDLLNSFYGSYELHKQKLLYWLAAKLLIRARWLHITALF